MSMALEKVATVAHLKEGVEREGYDNGCLACPANINLVVVGQSDDEISFLVFGGVWDFESDFAPMP